MRLKLSEKCNRRQKTKFLVSIYLFFVTSTDQTISVLLLLLICNKQQKFIIIFSFPKRFRGKYFLYEQPYRAWNFSPVAKIKTAKILPEKLLLIWYWYQLKYVTVLYDWWWIFTVYRHTLCSLIYVFSGSSPEAFANLEKEDKVGNEIHRTLRKNIKGHFIVGVKWEQRNREYLVA